MCIDDKCPRANTGGLGYRRGCMRVLGWREGLSSGAGVREMKIASVAHRRLQRYNSCFD